MKDIGEQGVGSRCRAGRSSCVRPARALLLYEDTSRRAASASVASRISVRKKLGGWPANRLSSVKAFTAATAPEFAVDDGRMTETLGRAATDERARLGQDQVGLLEFVGVGAQIGEREAGFVVRRGHRG